MTTNLWDGLKDAKTFEHGNYLNEGSYLCEIVACKTVQTREKGPAFIADLKVIESSVPGVEGAERNWFQKMHQDSALGNIKSFILAALGLDLNNSADKNEAIEKVLPRIEAIAEAACGETQILAGKKVRVRVVVVKTRAGGDFSRHDWAKAS